MWVELENHVILEQEAEVKKLEGEELGERRKLPAVVGFHSTPTSSST